jgi:hypothetical protein
MTDRKPSGSQLPAELRRVLPLLAGLFALLAAWLAWGGIQQWRDARLSEAVEQSRDSLLAGSSKTLATLGRQLADRLASAPVQAALRSGDDAAVARIVGENWKEAGDVRVLPADLTAGYAAPAEFGFSKLALLEVALSQGAPVARVVREGKQPRLGLAAPAGAKVIYLDLPLALLTDSLDQAKVPERGYVALRQGSYNVREAGSRSLASGAEALARPVGKTGLRVAASVPDGTEAPLGLGAQPLLHPLGLELVELPGRHERLHGFQAHRPRHASQPREHVDLADHHHLHRVHATLLSYIRSLLDSGRSSLQAAAFESAAFVPLVFQQLPQAPAQLAQGSSRLAYLARAERLDRCGLAGHQLVDRGPQLPAEAHQLPQGGRIAAPLPIPQALPRNAHSPGQVGSGPVQGPPQAHDSSAQLPEQLLPFFVQFDVIRSCNSCRVRHFDLRC